MQGHPAGLDRLRFRKTLTLLVTCLLQNELTELSITNIRNLVPFFYNVFANGELGS